MAVNPCITPDKFDAWMKRAINPPCEGEDCFQEVWERIVLEIKRRWGTKHTFKPQQNRGF